MPKPQGRPTKLTDDVLRSAREYLEENGSFASQLIVTIEGLSLHLHISKETLYRWETEDEDFRDVLGELRQLQANRLIQYGLNNKYNPTITKLLLSKHGYIEKKEQDITTKGESINEPNSELADKFATFLKDQEWTNTIITISMGCSKQHGDWEPKETRV